MKEGDLEMYRKLKGLVDDGLDKESSLTFFSKLTPEDYGRIIEVLENEDIPGVSSDTKVRVLSILKQIRESALQ